MPNNQGSDRLRKAIGDGTHPRGDESIGLDFPRRWLLPLLLCASLYGAFRIAQTAVWAAGLPNSPIRGGERVLVSVVDACIMAALAPLALWTSRAFPITAGGWLRNGAVHLTVALAAAAAWIAGLLAAYALISRAPVPFRAASFNLAWLTSNLFAYALLVAVLHAFALQRRLRDRELHAARLQMQLTTARLETLRAQLHPHFLFNTLHTIAELIHLDPAGADTMVVQLSRLLRVSLDFTADAEVPLRRELEVLGAYLELQQSRMGSRLRVEVYAPPDLLGALVPPMILQPLVENAVRHGLGRRASPGVVSVSAAPLGSGPGARLVLRVDDDGVGLAGVVRDGVGLTNTRTRLAALYGDDQQLTIESREGGGVAARIELPLRRELPRRSPIAGSPGSR